MFQKLFIYCGLRLDPKFFEAGFVLDCLYRLLGLVLFELLGLLGVDLFAPRTLQFFSKILNNPAKLFDLLLLLGYNVNLADKFSTIRNVREPQNLLEEYRVFRPLVEFAEHLNHAHPVGWQVEDAAGPTG